MFIKKWWTTKTFWLGVLMCLGAIGEFLAGLPPAATIPQMISGIFTIIMRFFTSEPVTQKAAAKLNAKMAASFNKPRAG